VKPNPMSWTIIYGQGSLVKSCFVILEIFKKFHNQKKTCRFEIDNDRRKKRAMQNKIVGQELKYFDKAGHS
jgi:hypothetical protein